MSAAVSQYVLKVSARCDLACAHCYVFEHADQSWRAKPKLIAGETVRQAAWRIREHVEQRQLDLVHVVLHGGEPLLLGHDGLRDVIGALRSLIDPVTQLDLRIHTNGVRLDEGLCALFAEQAVKVGVSLDGDSVANDRHRLLRRRPEQLSQRPAGTRIAQGTSVPAALRRHPVHHRHAERSDRRLRGIAGRAPPRIDLLLPHATWDSPPHRPPGIPVPYADWLGRIHERWVADGCRVPIRFFDSLIAAWQGRPSGSEAAGLDPVDLLVIETDGSWEQADSLKTAFDGAPATGLNVFSHSVDEAAMHPGVVGRQGGLAALCDTCQACQVVRACGGGLYAHRYSSDNDFDNPSVYCDDLKELIPRVVGRRPAVSVMSERNGNAQATHALPLELLTGYPRDRATSPQWPSWPTRTGRRSALYSRRSYPRWTHNGSDLDRVAADGWLLLTELDDVRPEAVREVLTYPYVRVWATRCLQLAEGADADLHRAHLSALAGLAAAAALRAGVDAEITVPVQDGFAYLPGAGALAVEPGTGQTCVVSVSPSRVSTRHGGGEWHEVRHITAAGASFTVDDIDPFRDCQAWAPARLAPQEWAAWRSALIVAAEQLAVEVPDYARVIGAGLRSVVPMLPDDTGNRRSGTARHAFGALAASLPGSADMLGELLVHEMQHVKLAGLCDMFDLFDPADTALYQVPWRSDRRPVSGLLQGTYAHLAVADLWRSRSRSAPAGFARELFLRYRSWTEQGVETLRTAGVTPHGARFVDSMGATIEAWAGDG